MKQEFGELSDAGIAPLDILRMATINTAYYLGRSDCMGTVEPRRDADMVLLDADPLLNVGNMHLIAGVVRGGHYFSNQHLEAIKARVADHRGTLA